MLVQTLICLRFFIALRLISLDHVLLIGACGLLLALLICFIVRVKLSSWFAAIRVVVFVGGLLVMFSYFLSICPNYYNVGPKLGVVLGLCLRLAILSRLAVEVGVSSEKPIKVIEVDIIYGFSSCWILIFFGGVLLLNLYVVVSIVSLVSGPLRPFVKSV